MRITPVINSRPSSASQKTDLTVTNDPTTARTGSRPSSASRKQDNTTTDDSTTEQQENSALFNSNDPNVTQPIIGRPPSAAKKTSSDEPNTITTLAENASLSDENKLVETTAASPRIGSASKNHQPSTTTENES
jgi:hypothetical protein